MKTIKLNEASSLSTDEKMRLCDIGQRKQNWGACSVGKLRENYVTCLYRNYRNAGAQAEGEILRRGFVLWLAPRVYNITNISTSHAQLLWDNRKTYHRVIQQAIDIQTLYGSDVWRPSEFLFRAFLLASAMNRPEMQGLIDAIKACMRDQMTYSGIMPKYLEEAANNKTIMEAVAKAVSEVDYTK